MYNLYYIIIIYILIRVYLRFWDYVARGLLSPMTLQSYFKNLIFYQQLSL